MELGRVATNKHFAGRQRLYAWGRPLEVARHNLTRQLTEHIHEGVPACAQLTLSEDGSTELWHDYTSFWLPRTRRHIQLELAFRVGSSGGRNSLNIVGLLDVGPRGLRSTKQL